MDNFFKGVLDIHLKTVKENVLGNAVKHNDFNVTQQYFKTVCSIMAEQDKSNHLAFATERDGGSGDGGGGDRGGRCGGRGSRGRTGRRNDARDPCVGRVAKGNRVSLDSSTSYSNKDRKKYD